LRLNAARATVGLPFVDAVEPAMVPPWLPPEQLVIAATSALQVAAVRKDLVARPRNLDRGRSLPHLGQINARSLLRSGDIPAHWPTPRTSAVDGRRCQRTWGRPVTEADRVMTECVSLTNGLTCTLIAGAREGRGSQSPSTVRRGSLLSRHSSDRPPHDLAYSASVNATSWAVVGSPT
jgi:hypothetical protein